MQYLEAGNKNLLPLFVQVVVDPSVSDGHHDDEDS